MAASVPQGFGAPTQGFVSAARQGLNRRGQDAATIDKVLKNIEEICLVIEKGLEEHSCWIRL